MKKKCCERKIFFQSHIKKNINLVFLKILQKNLKYKIIKNSCTNLYIK